MISTMELGTLRDLAVLEDPLASANDDVVDLLGHITKFWYQEPQM